MFWPWQSTARGKRWVFPQTVFLTVFQEFSACFRLGVALPARLFFLLSLCLIMHAILVRAAFAHFQVNWLPLPPHSSFHSLAPLIPSLSLYILLLGGMDAHTAAAGHGLSAVQWQHDVLSVHSGEISPRGACHSLQVGCGGLGWGGYIGWVHLITA